MRALHFIAASGVTLALGAIVGVGCATGFIPDENDASVPTDAALTCDVCADGQVCNSGTCSSSCSAGEIVCSGNCTNTLTDSNHCGSCTHACPTGYDCTNGKCMCASPTLGCAPQADSGSDAAIVCIDPKTDTNNCGACGNVCTDGGANAIPGCADGGCGIGSCIPPYDNCNMSPTDGCGINLSTDNNNCGACGLVCDAGSPNCSDGGCISDPCGNGTTINTGDQCDGTLGVPSGGQITCWPGGSKDQCFFDFASVPQLYCNGSCSWAGGNGCTQADANIFCQLTVGSSTSTATSFTTSTAEAVGGFSCPGLGTNLGTMPKYGVTVSVWYQGTSILANHGAGAIINSAVCTP